MRIGVILASHGAFAQAALGADEMIAGKQPDDIAHGLTEFVFGEAYETLCYEFELVGSLCDIYVGSPFIGTTRRLLIGMNLVAYTGLSMPVSVELLLTRDGLDSADAVRAQLTAAHAGAQQEIKAPAPAVEADEDDLDL